MTPFVLILKPVSRLFVIGVPIAAFGLAGLIGVIVVTSALAIVVTLQNLNQLPPELKKVEKDLSSDPRVTGAVATISDRAHFPAPRSGVVSEIDHDSYQAIAARRPAPGTVMITRPLLDRLDDGELVAVLGHELAHIWHPIKGRIAILTVWGLLAGAFVETAYGFAMFGPHLRGSAFIYSLLLLIGLLLFARPLLALFPAALSRRAEYSADEWACRMGCDGLCLATALWESLAGEVNEVADRRGPAKLNAHARKLLQTLNSSIGGRGARAGWTAARRRDALTRLCRSDLVVEHLTGRLLASHPSVVRRTRRLLDEPPPPDAPVPVQARDGAR